jgi:hypothetical protein
MTRNVVTTKERGDKARKEFFQRITRVMVDEEQASITEPQQSTSSEQPQGVLTASTTELPKPTLQYNDPIKRQPVFTFDKITEPKKVKVSIVEDEGRSFAEILTDYDAKKLDLRYIMDWPITSKPWAICNELGTIRASSKSLFRNNLQLLSPVQPTSIAPADIECSIVDAMRVVRIIPISGLIPPTFKSWANRIVGYLKSLPGSTVHLVFDDYRSEEGHIYLSKGRPDRGRERSITDLSQILPKLHDWNDFLTNDINKLQITQLLADYVLSAESDIRKEVYVTKGNQCMYLSADMSLPATEVPELQSHHKEADPRLALHAVYATSRHRGTCVVADDTDVYILMIFVAAECEGCLYFRQGTTSSKVGITYHNVKALADHLGEEVSKSLPAFHVLTGSDFTQPFLGRSKYRCFRKMLGNPDTTSLLSSLVSEHADVDKVTDFVLHVIYNRPKKEKTPGDSRYAMLFSGKGKKRKFTPLKRLPPDRKSLKCAIQRVNLVVHGMVNCLNQAYDQLDVLQYGWKVEVGTLVPIWYEGNSLPSNEESSQIPSAEAPQSTPNMSEHDTSEDDDTDSDQEDIPMSEDSSDDEE